MSHVSQQRPNTAPETPPQLLQRNPASSSVTPTFARSIHEPANAQILSPDVKTPTTPHPKPDLTDIFTPGQATTSSTPATAGSETTPAQWSKSKRKPVPGLLVLPSSSLNETVPASHPFARSVSSIKSSSIEEPASTPLSPRHGPLPPRRQGAHSRNVSLNRKGSPLSPAESTLSESSGLFWASDQPVNTPKSGGEMEVLKGDQSEPLTAAKALLGVGASTKQSSSADPSSKPVSQSSSGHTPPNVKSNTNPEASLSTITPPSAPVSNSPSPEPTSTVNGGQHPLRMRFDKSLPALPLGEEAASPSRPTHRQAQTGSTSSDPSTQLVTPRSTSHRFPFRSPDQEARENERTRINWPKRLGALTRAKTSKAKAKPNPDVNTGDLEAPAGLADADEDETFSVDRIPSKRRLWEAGTLFITDENGDLVCFGDMFPKMPDHVEPGQPIPKTAVFFIRHFWCGQCQDYMFASLSQLDPVALEKAGIKVIVISNGSWKIIKSYRELFKCPFPIYVDGPRKLYQLMG